MVEPSRAADRGPRKRWPKSIRDMAARCWPIAASNQESLRSPPSMRLLRVPGYASAATNASCCARRSLPPLAVSWGKSSLLIRELSLGRRPWARKEDNLPRGLGSEHRHLDRSAPHPRASSSPPRPAVNEVGFEIVNTDLESRYPACGVFWSSRLIALPKSKTTKTGTAREKSKRIMWRGRLPPRV